MTYPELKQYFSAKTLPERIELHPAIVITDPKLFVETQLIQIEAQGVKSPGYGRLMELVRKLESNVE